MDGQVLLSRGGGIPVDENGNPLLGAPVQAAPPQQAVDPNPLPDGPSPVQGQEDVWGNQRESAFYADPGAYQQPDPTPNPGSGETNPFYPQIFNQRKNPPSGWFSMDDYFAANRPAQGEPGWDTQAATPWQFQGGANVANSTNDYRLFGGLPGEFMINGHIINLFGTHGGAAPFSNPAPDQPGHSGTGYNSGASLGVPIAFTIPGWSGGTTFGGYPGDITGYHQMGPSNGG